MSTKYLFVEADMDEFESPNTVIVEIDDELLKLLKYTRALTSNMMKAIDVTGYKLELNLGSKSRCRFVTMHDPQSNMPFFEDATIDLDLLDFTELDTVGERLFIVDCGVYWQAKEAHNEQVVESMIVNWGTLFPEKA